MSTSGSVHVGDAELVTLVKEFLTGCCRVIHRAEACLPERLATIQYLPHHALSTNSSFIFSNLSLQSVEKGINRRRKRVWQVHRRSWRWAGLQTGSDTDIERTNSTNVWFNSAMYDYNAEDEAGGKEHCCAGHMHLRVHSVYSCRGGLFLHVRTIGR